MSRKSASDGDDGALVRVYIADDHPMVRAGIRAMLNDPEVEVVGDAATGDEAVDQVRDLQPDVVLMDINMPGIDGLTATKMIKSRHPEVAVIIITGDDSTRYIRRAIEAGAAGYLVKGAPRHVLLQAVKLVREGGSLIDAGLLATLAADADAEDGAGGRANVDRLLRLLSPREMKVLHYLAQGLTNKEIAREMSYSVGTVKNVVQRIIEKLHVADRTQAAVYAARGGLD